MSSEESQGTSRSGFLKQAAGATIAVAGAGVGAGALAQQADAATGFTSGRFSLEIDGVNVGAIAGVAGGVPEYGVALDPVGSDSIQRKHVTGIKWEPFSIRVGCGMGKGMYDWIQNSFDKGSVRKNGAVISADFNLNEKARREFTNALITEVTFPALDGASKDPAYLTVTFSPDSVADVPPSGLPVQAARQKAWLPANFRLVIDGVDTTRVASIDSFTWKQKIIENPTGGSSVVLDAGDLGVFFPSASLPSWQRWYDNFAVGGDATDERHGILELVGASGAVLDLDLSNLGIYQLKGDTLGSSARRFKVKCYCERLLPTVNK